MLGLFFKRSNKQITSFLCVQLCNSYSTKNSGDKWVPEVKNENVSQAKATSIFKRENNGAPIMRDVKLETDDPVKKIKRCSPIDAAITKRNSMFWKDFKNPVIDENREVIDWDNPNAALFPNHCDLVIIGGGAVGSSIAYWCKTMGLQGLRILVVEKDQTYREASTVLSVGGVRQQFSLEENIKMSLFGAEFLRNINDYLGVEGEPPIDVHFHPYGYLSLATPEHADQMRTNSELQNSLGAKNVLLNANQLKSKFPWLTTDDIELGCLGLENEGWFDPWSLLSALRNKAISMGVEFVTAEAKGFFFKKAPDVLFAGCAPGEYEEIDHLVVQTADGKERPITFNKCIIAAGAFSADIARMARIGCGKNLLSVPLPVEPRKRYVYCFHAPDGPGLNIPQTIEPSGTYFRQEGPANHYICGRCPEEHEEPATDNLDVDPEFFDNNIWPILANRVKAFENLKVKSSWAGYYEYNTFDENAILGYHPYYNNIIFATGFSGHGIQQSPAVGRAISELVNYSCYRTIHLDKLGFERFFSLEPMREANIW